MNIQEHLQKIKTKCQELLAIAEKRTAGKWNATQSWVGSENSCIAATKHFRSDGDADFIASCAGAAEAGWKATIAAIDDCKPQPMPEGYCHPDNPVMCENTPLIHDIIAAWPQELL